MYKSIIAVLIFVLIALSGFAQVNLKGKIQDADNGEDLIGASVIIKDTTTGTVTDVDGSFLLKVESLPLTIVISYLGYDTQEQIITEASEKIKIKLSTSSIIAKEVVIKGQIIDEKKKAAPLTVESLSPIAIKQTASENFYDGLGALKGVDLTSASLGIKVVNTRGFNSTAPVRILQTIDGVDNASPSINFALGNFLGSSELGVIKMDSKDPFFSKGLSAYVKGGERNIFEAGIRWTDAIRNKNGDDVFAYKLNFSYLTADDWEANNFAPIDSSKVPETHYASYDAVNIHGDEYDPALDFSKVSPWSSKGMTIFYRNGYKESELLEYETTIIWVVPYFKVRRGFVY